MKNISEHHICNMIRFAREYGTSILQQTVAKLPEQALLAVIPWGHHCILIDKIKDVAVRLWYMEQTATNGWSRDTPDR
jgi:predicted nuclease of restriction endonuclease-like (RecB) superfamily